ncbi:MAG: cell division topological specificity factor MinE [Anaerolineae bacterium]|jgi:cell division topological specificity factor|nr:cell division topological specificity factor MinE [Anaerolineae bacterium]
MTSLIDRLLGRKTPTSAELARERLKLVLVTDRSDLSPETLEQMQAEIIQVITRYIKIDQSKVHIKLEQRARENYLVADIPLVRDHSQSAAPPPPAPAGSAQLAEPEKPSGS